MDYILMNKDVPCALFSCEQDEFGEESAVLREWYTDLRPIGLQSLTAWLEKRKAPKHRKHIEQLLEQYGCVGLEGFLRVTHALSLNDTFWVKAKSETLCWDPRISPKSAIASFKSMDTRSTHSLRSNVSRQ